jgi:hypothetical protein
MGQSLFNPGNKMSAEDELVPDYEENPVEVDVVETENADDVKGIGKCVFMEKEYFLSIKRYIHYDSFSGIQRFLYKGRNIEGYSRLWF